MSFLVPNTVSQDLLLIRDLIGVPEPLPPKPLPLIQDDIDSSGSENGSEDEIEADLVKVENEEKKLEINNSAPTDLPSGSDSDTDSDSSDSEGELPSKLNIKDLDVEDDEESGAAAPTTTYFQTKNELVETDITVPDIEEVGADEVLERVGEVMSIVEKTVIVKGAPSEVLARASGQALDSDTLLVFEDRKVLGYIYETFGPTSQPLYQVKFSASYPVDQEKVQLSRPVFHVPQRSRFVFLNQIRRFKGSDASNMHDEEPGDEELEFSDDEAEAAYKSSLKRNIIRRESRANSMSRQSTPALMRDQDLALLERNPYDDHSPYDDNFASGPSRPAPMPYDDPYADEYTNMPSTAPEPPLPPPTSHRENSLHDSEGFAPRGRGRGRGRGGFERSEGRYDRTNEGRGRGRGRDRERGKGGRGRGDNDRRRSDGASWEGRTAISPRGSEPYDSSHQRPPRPLSPTSMAIARATGQFADGSEFMPESRSAPASPWAAFDPSQQFNYGGYPQFVQPHINPRFASAFGMNLDFQNPSPQPYYQPPPPSGGSSWTDEWTVHGGGNDASNGGPQ
ncbi:Gar1/Naf1 RNA binding region-domain-containing protein [Mycena filopes]|nr:Gar1/Naf1 RNA binding region-domain-containing protein [Mycena filopes]